jgi:hypothetical protein
MCYEHLNPRRSRGHKLFIKHGTMLLDQLEHNHFPQKRIYTSKVNNNWIKVINLMKFRIDTILICLKSLHMIYFGSRSRQLEGEYILAHKGKELDQYFGNSL